MDKLFTLLELQNRAQGSQSREALIHIIVNETLKIIPYSQGVFFTQDALSIKLERSSGNTVIDAQGLHAAEIKKFIRESMKDKIMRVIALSPEHHKAHGAILFFHTPEEGFLGGVWLEHAVDYSPAEIRILEELAGIYTQALALWYLRKGSSFLSIRARGVWKKYALAALALLALLPVRLSISAPAEIVAKESNIITAPFDGMIETIGVEPGEKVKEGDILALMESRSLYAQMDLAEQEILIAQSALSRMQRESLTFPDKKINLVELQQDIESKRISRDYAQSMKERSKIIAPSGGIAIFSGSHSLTGKPVRTGEMIMMIAQPDNYELLVRVPVESMMNIPEKAKISFFLNVSPLRGNRAVVRSAGYQATADPDGMMTYKIIADLPKGEKNMRIGWKGTAHIKGDWSILSYAILRRPITSLRNLMGI
jgi:hypothetical protein